MPHLETAKIKVLTIVSGDLWAGAEAMVHQLLRGLIRYEDLDLSVIVLNEGRLDREMQSIGITVHVVDERLYSFPQIVGKCSQIVNSSAPDVIHAHRYKENLLALLLSSVARRAKRVSTLHGLPECRNRAGFLVKSITAVNFWMLSHFFTTVSVSEEIREVLVGRLGFTRDKTVAIHNGLELPAPPAAGDEKTGPFVIGSAGRLFPVKDYPLMIEVARSIASAKGSDIRFELAGDGPELQKLTGLVAGYGLDGRFVFRGHQDDMPRFYRGLDVYLCTSLHEGIPMTVLEALAHGIPVVAPAVGGLVEIVEDGKNGFLVKGRSPEDFAVKCLLLRDDSELRKRMAMAGRERAEGAFSVGKMVEKYHQLYRAVVDRR